MNRIQQREYKILCYFDDLAKKYDIPYFLWNGTLLGAIRHDGFIPWDDDIDIALTRTAFNRLTTIMKTERNDDFVLQYNGTEPGYFHPLPKMRLKNDPIHEVGMKHMDISTGAWVDLFILDVIPDNEQKCLEMMQRIKKIYDRLHMKVFIYRQPEEKGFKAAIKGILHHFNVKKYKKARYRRQYQRIYNNLLHEMTRYSTDQTNRYGTFVLRHKPKNLIKWFLTKSQINDLVPHPFETREFPVPRDYHEILTKIYGDYMQLPPLNERQQHLLIGDK